MPAPLAALFAAWPIWLAMTLVLGGAAAFATGRALALVWRPFGIGILYAAALAAAVDFLCYALFDVSAIPAGQILDVVSKGDFRGAVPLLAGWAITFLILALIAFSGWRLTRQSQMRRQYPFLGRSTSH